MMDVERRLQHAARELREIEIEPPPLESLGGRRRVSGVVGRIPALVMPVLFVLGGLAVVAGGLSREADDGPSTAASATVEVPSSERDVSGDERPVLTAQQEVALISSLGPPTARPGESAAPAGAADLRTLTQRYR